MAQELEALQTGVLRGPTSQTGLRPIDTSVSDQKVLSGLESLSTELKLIGDSERKRKITNDIIRAKAAFAYNREMPGGLAPEAILEFGRMEVFKAGREFLKRNKYHMDVFSVLLLQADVHEDGSPYTYLQKQASFEKEQDDAHQRFFAHGQFNQDQTLVIQEMLEKSKEALSQGFLIANMKDKASDHITLMGQVAGEIIDEQILRMERVREEIAEAANSDAFEGAVEIPIDAGYTADMLDEIKEQIHRATPSLSPLEVDLLILAQMRARATDPTDPIPWILNAYDTKRANGGPKYTDIKALQEPIRAAKSAAWTVYNALKKAEASASEKQLKIIQKSEEKTANEYTTEHLIAGNPIDTIRMKEYITAQWPNLTQGAINRIITDYNESLNNPNSGVGLEEDVNILVSQIEAGFWKDLSIIQSSDLYKKGSSGQQGLIRKAFTKGRDKRKERLYSQLQRDTASVLFSIRNRHLEDRSGKRRGYRIDKNNFVLFDEWESNAVLRSKNFLLESERLLEKHSFLDTLSEYPAEQRTLFQNFLGAKLAEDKKAADGAATKDKDTDKEEPKKPKKAVIDGGGSADGKIEEHDPTKHLPEVPLEEVEEMGKALEELSILKPLSSTLQEIFPGTTSVIKAIPGIVKSIGEAVVENSAILKFFEEKIIKDKESFDVLRYPYISPQERFESTTLKFQVFPGEEAKKNETNDLVENFPNEKELAQDFLKRNPQFVKDFPKTELGLTEFEKIGTGATGSFEHPKIAEAEEKVFKEIASDETVGGKINNKVYKDTLDIDTIGIGYNLEKDGAKVRLAKMGLDVDKLRAGTQTMSDAQATELFTEDIEEARENAKSIFKNYNELSIDRQDIITNMLFQLGRPRFLKFTNFIKALRKGDFQKAREEMLFNFDPKTGKKTGQTKWHTQTPKRANRLADRMFSETAKKKG